MTGFFRNQVSSRNLVSHYYLMLRKAILFELRNPIFFENLIF
jgi:hypothetical protein